MDTDDLRRIANEEAQAPSREPEPEYVDGLNGLLDVGYGWTEHQDRLSDV